MEFFGVQQMNSSQGKISLGLMWSVPLLAVAILSPNWAMPLYEDEFGTHLGLPLYLAISPYLLFIALYGVWAWKASPSLFTRTVWLQPLASMPFCLMSWGILNHDSQSEVSRNTSALDLLIVSGIVLTIAYALLWTTKKIISKR
jgi:hypothetical protein